jgi:hypothetical protein
MKNKILTVLLLLVYTMIFFVTTSCEDLMGDFLEKAPSSDVTEDSIFRSALLTEDFLAAIYQFGIHANLGYGAPENGYTIAFADPSPNLFSGACDESEVCASWYETNWWNAGDIHANRGTNIAELDGRFEYRFKAIRMVTILLDRIDDVPDSEMDQTTKRQLKGEAKTIRALNYL